MVKHRTIRSGQAFWNEASVVEEFSSLEEQHMATITPAQKRGDKLFGKLATVAHVSSGSVIDFGCGLGTMRDFLPDDGVSRYVGIDCSEGIVRRATLKHPDVRFIHADIIDASKFVTDPFDLFIARNSLQFVNRKRLKATLSGMRSCVREGAAGFLMTYAGTTDVRVQYGDRETMAHEWTAETLLPLLWASGFALHWFTYQPGINDSLDLSMIVRAV